MPGFFVDRRKVYRVEVETSPDPDTEEVTTSWVDLKRFTEGDIQDRNDIATQIRTEQRRDSKRKMQGYKGKGGRRRRGQPGNDQEASMQYALGALRGFDLQRSIVDWGLTDDQGVRVPPTPENIRALDPYTAGQIHDEIAYLNPSVFPQGDEDERVSGDGGLEYDEDYEGEDGHEPQNEDDEQFGADEDAPPEAGGIGNVSDGETDEEEEEDPTRMTSDARRSRR